MTLDFASEEFKSKPDARTATALLQVATDYWADGMIEDTTFAGFLEDVAIWLRTED